MTNIMNQYTTFHKVLDYLQYFQEQAPMLNTFGYGNLVDFGKNISGSSVAIETRVARKGPGFLTEKKILRGPLKTISKL